MYTMKATGTIALAIIAVSLSACTIGQQPEPTIDVGAVFTEAAQTVAAQFAVQQTQTALAAPTETLPPPTATQIPTFSFNTSPSAPLGTPQSPLATSSIFSSPTPLGVLPTPAGPLCNDSVFIEDTTIPDGTIMAPGEDFAKAWKIQNSGTCRWDEGYFLAYLGGDLDGYSFEFKKSGDFVDPGEAVVLKIDLTAPLAPNTYTDCWRMKSDGGYYFGTYVCATIEVRK